ncbi:MAG: AAA family ATPase [bacterium]|nr:AAA family ATPase [bacterium]
MYLNRLHIRNLKRIRELEIDCTHDGAPRMWTVLIGANGTGKSSILHAIALAAAGWVRANKLANPIESLPSRLPGAGGLELEATFSFGARRADEREYPDWDCKERPGTLTSHLSIKEGFSDFMGRSHYDDLKSADPLSEARSRHLPHWFVAGYGVHRTLPESTGTPRSDWRSTTDRLRPLFEVVDLMALRFATELEDTLAAAFKSAVETVVRRRKKIIPDLLDVELHTEGARTIGAIAERFVAVQSLGKAGRSSGSASSLRVPASALSHGFQSSLAWIADLVGHLILEKGTGLKPEEMEGLVLVDEIDLYLHPEWQVALIAALRETFPLLQFIVTTHSPILLTGLRRHEVVRLDVDTEGGIEAGTPLWDPRLLTGTQLYSRFFDVSGLYPAELGGELHRYGFLAANPYRSAPEDQEMKRLAVALRSEGIDPGLKAVPRARR